jgi:hypothetical protein
MDENSQDFDPSFIIITQLINIMHQFISVSSYFSQEECRARDLFYGLWIPDLFMRRVQENGTWSLFCPNEAPGLADCWGEEFEKLYTKYEIEVTSFTSIISMH